METIVFYWLKNRKHPLNKPFALLFQVSLCNWHFLPRKLTHRTPVYAFWEVVRAERILHQMQQRIYELGLWFFIFQEGHKVVHGKFLVDIVEREQHFIESGILDVRERPNRNLIALEKESLFLFVFHIVSFATQGLRPGKSFRYVEMLVVFVNGIDHIPHRVGRISPLKVKSVHGLHYLANYLSSFWVKPL